MECCSHIEIATSKHIEEPLSVVELFKNFGECSFKKLMKFMSVDIDQQTLVQEMTSNQSKSDHWFKYSRDRITASKFKDSIMKVNDALEIINPDKSRTLLSKICGYYTHYQSKATK